MLNHHRYFIERPCPNPLIGTIQDIEDREQLASFIVELIKLRLWLTTTLSLLVSQLCTGCKTFCFDDLHPALTNVTCWFISVEGCHPQGPPAVWRDETYFAFVAR